MNERSGDGDAVTIPARRPGVARAIEIARSYVERSERGETGVAMMYDVAAWSSTGLPALVHEIDRLDRCCRSLVAIALRQQFGGSGHDLDARLRQLAEENRQLRAELALATEAACARCAPEEEP